MKKVLKDLLDGKPLDIAVAAIYYAIRIIKHQKNMLLENIKAESSIEEKQLGIQIVSIINKVEHKLLSDFSQNDVNKYIIELSTYIEERNKEPNKKSSNKKQDMLQAWRNESVHNYDYRHYERKFKPTVFISYQSDQELSMALKNFFLDLKIEVIIWDTLQNESKTLFSRFIEATSLTDFAIFILNKSSDRLKQNQFFELGYLLGKLGRENVIIFTDETSSIPTDLSGLKLLNLKSNDWQYDLAVQIDLAGIEFEKRKIKK